MAGWKDTKLYYPIHIRPTRIYICVAQSPGVFGVRFGFLLGFLWKKHRIHTVMNLLAIETSGAVLSVAVKKGRRPIRQAFLKGRMKHAESLIPAIDKVLKKERLDIRDIDAFLIARGPGSFTGLRVGFATLKGFLAVRPRPCYGALSLDLIARGTVPFFSVTREKGGCPFLAVCINAKRDKLYARFYRAHKKSWKAAGKPYAVSPDEWLKSLPAGTLISGDGLALCGKTVPKSIHPLQEKLWVPRAGTLIGLYEKKDPLLKRLKSPKDLLPFYLRASEAEERLKKIS